MSKIEIFSPRWHDRKVLIAKYKVGIDNEIVFTKAKNLMGMTFKMKGSEIEKYPVETNGVIECFCVPLDVILDKKEIYVDSPKEMYGIDK